MNRKNRVKKRLFSVLLSTALVAGMFPALGMPVASAAAADPVYAAAYMGAKSAAGTTLPASVRIGGQEAPVSWNIGEDTFDVPYDTVAVTGTANGGPVTASVEVIPPADSPLVYFVDSGRGGDSFGYGPAPSPLYEAVRTLTGSELLNSSPDQKYVAGTTDWGFDDSIHKVKNSKNGNLTDPATDPSLWVVGLRADPASNDIIYKLKALQSGVYTLSSGFYDWYGTRDRAIQPRLEYVNTAGVAQTISFTPFNTNKTKFISGEFTVPGDIDTSSSMTLTYANVGGEKPILSWFAVAKGAIKQKLDNARETAASTVRIQLDGKDIKDGNVNGLTFKGFGVLSGNSTSALLMDYKSEQPEAYAQLLQILFGGDRPLIDHVKIEMGNDRNNSTGPDPSTMRTEDEEANVARHPGFQLAADAKAVNPAVKVSFLRWNAPAWANNNDKIYTWYKKTILAAYRQYGYMVDYVNPHINEHAPDLAWTKEYGERVKADASDFKDEQEKELYHSIKLVISDEVGIGSFGDALVNDLSLREAVAAAGYHYNTDDDSQGNFKRLADEFDKEIWNSEAQATFSNSAFRPHNNMKDPSVPGTGIGGTGGPLEMGNTIIKGFVNSRRTHFIYQPAIGSFYEGGQYSFKELLSARDPWSGFIHYDAGLLVLKHFGGFAKTGWENEDNTAGIWRAVPQASYTGATGTNPVSGRNGTPSYMTLASPDKQDFSTVIINDSEVEKIYKLKAVNMAYTGNPSLEMWETRAAESGQAFNSNYMKDLGDVQADGSGVYTIRVKPFSIVTVTTLDNRNKEGFSTPLPVEGERTVLDTDVTGSVQNTEDQTLYADDFNYGGRSVPVIGEGGQITGVQSYASSRGGPYSVMPRYTQDLNGAFEGYLVDGTDNYVLRQQLDQTTTGVGGAWNGGDPVTAIGDYRWTNYKASADVSFDQNSTYGGNNYAAVGARYQGGPQTINGTPYAFKFWFDGGWQLLSSGTVVASGNAATGTGGVKIPDFNTAYDAWHNIAIQVAGDTVTAYLDQVELASYTDSNAKLSGRVQLASGFYHVRFDNLKVEKVDGHTPYYSEQLDNLEMTDLAEVPRAKLVYEGNWAHENGKGMYVYQRSLSTSQGAGAVLKYTFTGTGLDILGPNDGSAKLEAVVDGETLVVSGAAGAAKELYQTFTLRGLNYGEHTVQIKVLSGTLAVDSVAVIGGEGAGNPDTAELKQAVSAAVAVSREDDYPEQDWRMFKNALDTSQAALNDPVLYRLDQEGATQLAERLSSALNLLLLGDVRELASIPDRATYAGQVPELPAKVEATLADGTTTQVAVKWNLDAVSFDTPYERVAVTGTYGSLKTIAYVEVVPAGLVYFLDMGLAGDSDTPPYTAIRDLAGDSLLNHKADQLSTGDTVWGHTNTGTNYSVKGLGGDVVTTNKAQTGVYSSNTKNTPLVYNLPLSAGKYTVTSYHLDWWNNLNRTMDITLSYPDAEGEIVTETVKTGLVAGAGGAGVQYNFTLPVNGTVKYSVNNTFSQASLISYLAVARDKTSVDNEQAVAEAKSIIEGASYSVKKAQANSEEAVRSWLAQTISGMPGFKGTGVTLGDITLSAFQAATEDTEGSFTFSVTLSKGEAAAEATASGTITLPVTDTVPPVITLIGEATVNLPIGAEYTDAGATAYDDQDGDITGRITTTVTSEVYGLTELDTSKEDIYTFHYNVTDKAGNTAAEVTRRVVVALDPDVTKPVITLLGEATVQLEKGASYADAGATAADDRDGDITERIVATITQGGETVPALDTSASGSYVYHYNVTDTAGNAAAEVTRTVTVREEELPPEVNPTKAPTPVPTATPAPAEVPVWISAPAATPSPTVAPSPSPQKEKVLTAADFPAPAGGAITVQLTDATESVLLPAGLAGIIGENTLHLAWHTFTVDLSPEVLKSIREKTAGAGGQPEGMAIRLSAVKTARTAAEQLINNPALSGSVRLSAASDVIRFGLETVAADGTAVPVATFNEPLTLTFTVDPGANRSVLGIYYIAANGALEYMGGRLTDSKLSAGISHFSQYAVLEYDKTFSDVSSNSWASGVIKSMAAKHIIEGISSSEFQPLGEVTRAQFAAMIARALGLKTGSPSIFADVDSGLWYAESVAAVNEAGIVLGRSKDAFAPNELITREEMAVMIVRAYEHLKGSKSSSESASSSFSDHTLIRDWAKNAVSTADQAGLIKGRGNQQFAPQATMTRAESAQVIFNLLEHM
ncbi:S-layer homology domain-containing protein [Paenibacillus sp. FSL H7-0350]|uniref:S-layer homology domain-containing protein n=1 Tax=Paenibacillus sp. FSL H7-0350 TaxID=2975345 RepID=UPI0031593B1C